MTNRRRYVLLVLCAITATLLAMLVPLAPFYCLMIAVALFVALARLLQVGSHAATLVFALLLFSAPIVMFAAVGAASSDMHFHDLFHWSVISISGLPAGVAFFLLPIALALATYAGRRWLYPDRPLNPTAGSR